MRVVHLSIVRLVEPGLYKQLRFESQCAAGLICCEWQTIAYHDAPVTESFIRRTPWIFRAMFMRYLWGWMLVLKNSKCCDLVLIRHMPFDPFAFLFAPFVANLVSIHHAKEVEELRLISNGWKGRAASCLEKISADFSLKHRLALLGVTREIAEYELATHAASSPIGIYANGIDLGQVDLLADNRTADCVNAIFICSQFAEWHGLDKLLSAIDAHGETDATIPFTIHLVGLLSPRQEADISATQSRRAVLKAHGLMQGSGYIPLMESCDFGIASLALERKGLTEASTLKVREMLAKGLPVYSGHKDIALPERACYVKITSKPSVLEMLHFAASCKRVSRDYVRARSAAKIDKLKIMEHTAEFLLKVVRPTSLNS